MPDHWTIFGNGGTDPTQNSLGTTDRQPLVIITNGAEAMRITPGTAFPTNGFTHVGGNIGIGTQQPEAKLHVSSASHFNEPQVEIRQTIPLEFARLRFFTFHERVGGGSGSQIWDIAASDRMNFFSQNVGNVMTLREDFVQHTRTFVPRVGIATENPETTLHVNGTATVAVLEITGGTDLAEPFPVTGRDKVEPGTVMVIDETCLGSLKISDRAYDRKVAGIVSGARGMKPGLTLRQGHIAEDGNQVALAGRVYCKAEALSYPIEPGHLLTTSDVPGHAMKAVDLEAAQGAILGKAMSPLREGKGLVLALVNLQ